MGTGFAVNIDDSYAGWYGHSQNFEAKKARLPAGVVFVADDDANPAVAALRAAKDAPPPPREPSPHEDLITLMHSGATGLEKAAAQARLDGRPVPGRN